MVVLQFCFFNSLISSKYHKLNEPLKFSSCIYCFVKWNEYSQDGLILIDPTHTHYKVYYHSLIQVLDILKVNCTILHQTSFNFNFLRLLLTLLFKISFANLCHNFSQCSSHELFHTKPSFFLGSHQQMQMRNALTSYNDIILLTGLAPYNNLIIVWSLYTRHNFFSAHITKDSPVYVKTMQTQEV